MTTANRPLLVLALAGAACTAAPATAQSRSLLAENLERQRSAAEERAPHALLDHSLFALAESRPRVFQPHDLIQIVVQERSSASSTQELETAKEATLDGRINAFPEITLKDLANLQMLAGRATGLPDLDVTLGKEFSGDGDYEREDEITTRISAEVMEVLPNGNLVLEARTQIRNDSEVTTIKVTGVCRGVDVTATNTVLSNRIHDLVIEKRNEGELRNASKKGLVTRFFDLLFAF